MKEYYRAINYTANKNMKGTDRKWKENTFPVTIIFSNHPPIKYFQSIFPLEDK